jgi:hypothetical protein
MIEHLSYSSISAFLACGQAWRYHYLDKVPTPGVPELVFGSAFHNTVEEIVSTPPPAADTWSTKTNELWSTHWNKQIESTPNIEWEKDTPEGYFNQGVKMLQSPEIIEGILSIKGGEIEKRVELKVPGVPVPIIGYIDVIDQNGIPYDLKTSSRAWTQDRALNELQPVYYLAALNQMGITVPGNRFVHCVFVKTKNPQFQRIETVHQSSEMFWLFGMIQNVWQGIEAGVFLKNPLSWKCDPIYCPYWHMCRGK